VKAIWNGEVLAESDDTIYIEGNQYFPKSSLNSEHFKPSSHKTTCFWKGEASYYNVEVGGEVNENAAWYYPEPMPGSIEKVKKDFTNYVAFWNGVEVVKK
jgi:uncharacterized protein (DUF427 family)